MANLNHVQLLLERAQIWNEKRAEEEFQPNLEGPVNGGERCPFFGTIRCPIFCALRCPI